MNVKIIGKQSNDIFLDRIKLQVPYFVHGSGCEVL